MLKAALLVLLIPMAAFAQEGGWPIEIIKRPPTLPSGMLRLQLDASLRFVERGGGMMMDAETETDLGLTVGSGYGITNEFEIGAAYGFLADEDVEGQLFLYGEYAFLSGTLDVAGTGGLVYDLGSENGALLLGAEVQFEIGDRFAIYTPGYQLGIGIFNDGDTPISLALPVGVRLQFTPQIFGFAQTTIATIGIKDSGDSSILDDVNLLVGAFYSISNKLDLGAAISIPESDDIGFLFTLRVFL
jgi:hypothetical protein